MLFRSRISFLLPSSLPLLLVSLSLLSFLMKVLVFPGLEFSPTTFAIALCYLSPILPKSHHLRFHCCRAASFAQPYRFLRSDLFWVSILALLALKLSPSVKLAISNATSPTPLQMVLVFGFGFMLMLCNLFYCLVLLFVSLFVRFSFAKCRVASPSISFQFLTVPTFLWHPFGCHVHCLPMGYLRVSLGFALLTAFCSLAGEARVIYDPLPTIFMYFLHNNFRFGCIVGEPTPYLVF